jgi:hypothetical protein
MPTAYAISNTDANEKRTFNIRGTYNSKEDDAKGASRKGHRILDEGDAASPGLIP